MAKKKMSIEETKSAIEKMRTPLDMGLLWCVYIYGADSNIAQPNRLLAEARAKLWQAVADQRFINDPHKYDPVFYCIVRPWEGSAESHAANLASHNGEPEELC